MTTRTLLSAMALACTLGFASTANAMPLITAPAVDAAPAVTLVVGGCGIGRHRGPGGLCRPNLYAPVYRAPFAYGARRCVVRPGVYGPRRVCY